MTRRGNKDDDIDDDDADDDDDDDEDNKPREAERAFRSSFIMCQLRLAKSLSISRPTPKSTTEMVSTEKKKEKKMDKKEWMAVLPLPNSLQVGVDT